MLANERFRPLDKTFLMTGDTKYKWQTDWWHVCERCKGQVETEKEQRTRTRSCNIYNKKMKASNTKILARSLIAPIPALVQTPSFLRKAIPIHKN